MKSVIQESRKKEYHYIYLLRAVACIAVVSLHSVGQIPKLYLENNIFLWWIQTVIYALTIWAVPVFVMISGALLLDNRKNESTREFYKKRIVRVGIPTLFWIPVYFLLYHLINGEALTVLTLWNNFLTGYYYHLYFLILILQLYLLTPLFRNLVMNLTSKYILILSLFFFFIGFIWRRHSFTIDMFIPYIGYFILGYYLAKSSFDKKKLQYITFIFPLFTLLFIFLTYFLTHVYVNEYIKNTFLYSHTNPVIILFAASTFIMFQHNKVISLIQNKISLPNLRLLSSTTLGIYIIHPIVQIIILYIAFAYFHITLNSFIFLLFLIPITLMSSFFIIWSIKRIPYIEKLV